ncbi:hypothetical protein [Sphingomonas sp.]|uniref:hypothetical protein n=1 Tax=Sphingomonas sp. TaxID=28214 RepID=UPI0025DE00B9|nr:hypothetical protein [Sphingomonas sp.]
MTASNEGGIILMWEEGAKELEIEVSPDGVVFSAYLIDAKGIEDEPEVPIDLERARAFVDKFCRN